VNVKKQAAIKNTIDGCRLPFPRKSGHMIQLHKGAFHTPLGSKIEKILDSSSLNPVNYFPIVSQ
jgi:hypothetical protein